MQWKEAIACSIDLRMSKGKFRSYVDFENLIRIRCWRDVNQKLPSFAKLL